MLHDLITSKGARGKSRKDGDGMRKQTQDCARGHTSSVGGPQQEDSLHKVSDSHLTLSRLGLYQFAKILYRALFSLSIDVDFALNSAENSRSVRNLCEQ